MIKELEVSRDLVTISISPPERYKFFLFRCTALTQRPIIFFAYSINNICKWGQDIQLQTNPTRAYDLEIENHRVRTKWTTIFCTSWTSQIFFQAKGPATSKGRENIRMAQQVICTGMLQNLSTVHSWNEWMNASMNEWMFTPDLNDSPARMSVLWRLHTIAS